MENIAKLLVSMFEDQTGTTITSHYWVNGVIECLRVIHEDGRQWALWVDDDLELQWSQEN